MKNFLATVLVGILIFILVIGVILLIAVGLEYVLQVIPCEILVYIETAVLLVMFMFLGLLIINPKVRATLFNR